MTYFWPIKVALLKNLTLWTFWIIFWSTFENGWLPLVFFHAPWPPLYNSNTHTYLFNYLNLHKSSFLQLSQTLIHTILNLHNPRAHKHCCSWINSWMIQTYIRNIHSILNQGKMSKELERLHLRIKLSSWCLIFTTEIEQKRKLLQNKESFVK